MDKDQLQAVLEKHKQWLEGNLKEGEHADLRDANLRDANLQCANLQCADLDFSCLPLRRRSVMSTTRTPEEYVFSAFEPLPAEGVAALEAAAPEEEWASSRVKHTPIPWREEYDHGTSILSPGTLRLPGPMGS